MFQATWILLALLLFRSSGAEAVQVAFFSSSRPHHGARALEPAGRFFHVAVSYRGQWLHAHPALGVTLSSQLSDFGDATVEIWENLSIPEPSRHWVQRELKKAYDPFFRWKNASATYCSKLVGRFLRISPTPMQFDGEFWRSPFPPSWAKLPYPTGALGLSPDEIAQWISHPAQASNWRRLDPEASCDEQLR